MSGRGPVELVVGNPEGRIRIHGEIWNARANGPGYQGGQKANINGIRRLVLLLKDLEKRDPLRSGETHRTFHG